EAAPVKLRVLHAEDVDVSASATEIAPLPKKIRPVTPSAPTEGAPVVEVPRRAPQEMPLQKKVSGTDTGRRSQMSPALDRALVRQVNYAAALAPGYHPFANPFGAPSPQSHPMAHAQAVADDVTKATKKDSPNSRGRGFGWGSGASQGGKKGYSGFATFYDSQEISFAEFSWYLNALPYANVNDILFQKRLVRDLEGFFGKFEVIEWPYRFS
ncbi:MAG: hypothetical protein KDD60_12830, partial [Bdellovibrionales bacterium]|nr:hypothetical protein [Bdellovibrionales bacterium]